MNVRDLICQYFPNIDHSFVITSPQDSAYNCIAWAAEDCARKWWPDLNAYWPIPNVVTPTVQAFLDAFATLGFELAEDNNLEAGAEKISIYIKDGQVTHMARQLPEGCWTSKLGDQWDIRHKTPECLNSDVYGAFHCSIVRRKDIEISF